MFEIKHSLSIFKKKCKHFCNFINYTTFKLSKMAITTIAESILKKYTIPYNKTDGFGTLYERRQWHWCSTVVVTIFWSNRRRVSFLRNWYVWLLDTRWKTFQNFTFTPSMVFYINTHAKYMGVQWLIRSRYSIIF